MHASQSEQLELQGTLNSLTPSPAVSKQTVCNYRKTTVESQHPKQIRTRTDGQRGLSTHTMYIYIYRDEYGSNNEAGKKNNETRTESSIRHGEDGGWNECLLALYNNSVEEAVGEIQLKMSG